MDENNNKNDLFDLGSDPVEVDFDPFAEDDAADDNSQADMSPVQEEPEVPDEAAVETPTSTDTPADLPAKAVETKEAEKPQQDDTEKPPVFEYAGATETIDDTSKTFDELRIEKSSDFPELEDGKRVSWMVEYGKITKTVADPKGTSIGKMRSDIETSKEFADNLKKRGADKNPTCKVKPRVTAQSKGVASAYKGVFVNLEEAEMAGKVISILPAKDGKVYEIRDTEMGRFITPVVAGSPGGSCELLSDVRAGFIPALPSIPADLMMQVFAFFRHYTHHEGKNEALLNIYWDKNAGKFVVDAPEQIVTEVSVNSQISDAFTDDRYIHYMDIHSHNTMPAFFSSVDDHDEKATRLYTVIGKLNECVPEIKTRISNGGKFLDIDPAEVFDFVELPFPDEWKDKVHSQPKHKKGIKKAFSVLCSHNMLSKLKKKLVKGVVHNAVFSG